MTFKSPHEVGSELWCEALSAHISERVEADSVAEFREPEPGRWHLGASEIGKPCSRALWYSFRWTLKVEHPGDRHRLFQRGHSEEPKFVARLARIGIQVSDRDPATGKQYQMVHATEPHYGGSYDGIGVVPWVPPEVSTMVTEFKTHNDNSFNKLVKDGVRKSKPQHYTQMCCYGEHSKLRYGLYCAVNKNTDALYWRVVPLQWSLGELSLKKAIHVIRSQTPPTRVSENSSYFECKFCDYRNICHLGAPVEKNCRSCKHATPNKQDKEWTCSLYAGVIPREFVPKGCDSWTPIA